MKQVRSPAREALAAAIKVKVEAAAEASSSAAAFRLFEENFNETRSTWYASTSATEAARHRKQQLLQMHGGNERAIAVAAASAGEAHPGLLPVR